MKKRSEHSHDFSTASPEEFLELFAFAGTCDFSNFDPSVDPVKSEFVAILRASFDRWRRNSRFKLAVFQGVQFALRVEQLREELTTVLFNHGAPNDRHLKTAFRLLFQVAYLRQQLAMKASAEATNAP